MKKIYKKQVLVNDFMKNHIKTKNLPINEAIESLKKISKITSRNFLESIDVAIKLNIDTKKETSLKGSFLLPHSQQKKVKICVFAELEKQKDIQAHLVGGEELIEKIKNNGIDFDICIATPLMMKKITTNKNITSILGQKGLMPNIKLGTITDNIPKIVNNINNGMLFYKSDKAGYIHLKVGKVSQSSNEIIENINSLLEHIKANKTNQKLNFISHIHVSTTMGKGFKITN
ncbi:hypothetical protein AB836_00325 [Rickettsiales bacterium (ex Bugula neritina AB1)]|nr:hypothetical protein AB836_00325 [Rickettsiales bacterium (ex Bugula neritina AB1)]